MAPGGVGSAVIFIAGMVSMSWAWGNPKPGNEHPSSEQAYTAISPAKSSPSPAEPSSSSSAAPLAIIGVSPERPSAGDTIRIFLSGPIYSGAENKTITAADIAVDIEGQSAPIKQVAGDQIIALVPVTAKPNSAATLQIVGLGMRLMAPSPLQIGEAVPTKPVGIVTDWHVISVAAIISACCFGGGAGLWLYGRRRRNALQQELERVKFRADIESGAILAVAQDSATNQFSQSSAEAAALDHLPAIPEALVAAIAARECTLFWGAGLSAQAGYPTWDEALKELISRTDQSDDLAGLLRVGRRSLVMEALKTRLGRDRLVREINSLWGQKREYPSHLRAISTIPFANVVSPVWDSLVEEAFASRKPTVVTGIGYEGLEGVLTRDSFCVVRLWGSVQRPDSLVFTDYDFRSALSANPNYAKYLSTLTLSHAHLFVGASIETIQDYLSLAPRESASHVHYALVPENAELTAARDVMRSQYNVELLTFQPSPGWPQVPAFLTSLASATNGGKDKTAVPTAESLRIHAVALENIGPFENLKLEFDSKWTVLLGINGAGKSTILRAIGLALCSDDSRAQASGAALLSSGKGRGLIQLTVGRDVYRTELIRDWKSGQVQVNAGARVSPLNAGRLVALAFPPMRGILLGESTGPMLDGVRPMVEDVLPILLGPADSRLSSLKQWVVNLDVRSKPGDGVTLEQAQANVALRARFFKLLNVFLPGLELEFSHVDRQTWKVYVTTHGATVTIDQISQGTNSTLCWVGALVQRMCDYYGADANFQEKVAVVLLDEIDAHLHPEWQQRIVGTLAQQFPDVQFIVTTHSPLIVLELSGSQIYRVYWNDGKVTARRPEQSIQGLGVAGLLASEAFGLQRLVDRHTEELLEKQRTLSASEVLSDDQKSALESVNEQLENLGFRYQTRDALYTEFLKQQRQEHQPTLEEAAELAAPLTQDVKSLIAAAVEKSNFPRE